MKSTSLLVFAAALAMAAPAAIAQATPAALPTSARQATAEFSQDGLERTNVRGLDIVFVRPGATLEGFTKVQLAPVSVAFRRNWERDAGTTGSRSRVRASDVERIRAQLATLVETVVREELERGGYTLVEDAGEDVLAVQMNIVNLNINAPDLATASRVRVYTTSVGEMTLVAELRDSSSGELMMRVYDRRIGRESIQPRFTTRTDNVMEARIAARAWAQALRKGLDSARTVTAAP